MEDRDMGKDKKRKKLFLHSEGITYFDKRTERIFFFILSIAMLVWGLFVKMGF